MKAPSVLLLRVLRNCALPETRQLCCYHVQSRYLRTSSSSSAVTKSPTPTTTPPPPRAASPSTPTLSYTPTPRNDDDTTPKPLTHPLGLPRPPRPSENTGIDTRTLRQRRNDLVDWDRHLHRRQEMTSQISRSYFRDFSAMRHHKGKTFLAPPRLWRREVSQYFPNLHGVTLAKGAQGKGEGGHGIDMVHTMRGRLSVVALFSSEWARAQVDAFCAPAQHPELHALLARHTSVAQLVEINHEPNALKYYLLRLFAYRLRGARTPGQQARYFIVRRGVTERIRTLLGLANSRVGYVYLVDAECRIRWAASARPEGDEKVGMIKGLKRLIDEAAKMQEMDKVSGKRKDGIVVTEKEIETGPSVAAGTA
ncbi:Mitochondrial ATPase complex subunit atp10 [Elasticomyces elasticus]|nr:Mitochondrial ATPase complex subunit atp10 [Elasticomyces elasticus]